MSDEEFSGQDLPPSKYHAPNTFASKPGKIRMSGKMYYYFLNQFKEAHKVKTVEPDFFPVFEEHLQRCDSNPAIVLKTEPTVVVAAATEDIDDVLFLEFDPDLLNVRPVKVGDRLVSVNSYRWKEDCVDPILAEGELASGTYGATFALIGDFMCEKPQDAHRARGQLPAEEWLRLEQLIQRRLDSGRTQNHPGNPFDLQWYLMDVANSQHNKPPLRRLRDYVEWFIIIACGVFLIGSGIMYLIEQSNSAS